MKTWWLALVWVGGLVLLLFGWWSWSQVQVAARLPGHSAADGDAGRQQGPAAPTLGELVKLPAAEAVVSGYWGRWPVFRGPGLDNVVDRVDHRLQWDVQQHPPQQRWRVSLGEGYAGAAIWDGLVYLLDYDAETASDVLRCFALADGSERWRYRYPVKIKPQHGMSRTVPAVNDRWVVTLGPKCHVMCLDRSTGELLWSMDLVRQFGTRVPQWYAGQCPLIDGDRVILAPAGDDVLLMAVDGATGQILWQTPNPMGWQMTHVSVSPMMLDGKPSYVYCGSGGVVGVSAEEGRILWSTDAWRISIATVPSPVVVGDRRVFLTGGYGAGSMMLRIQGDLEQGYAAKVVWRIGPEVFASAQWTPVLYNGYLYAVRPDKQFACLGLDGKLVWSSGVSRRFGDEYGPCMVINNRLVILDGRSGELVIADPSPVAWRETGRVKVLDGGECWAPPAWADGRLLVRDMKQMVCLDLTASLEGGHD